jgi:hypothetical protein
MTMICRWFERASKPSLTNGFPVATTALKYERFETFRGVRGAGVTLETLEFPVRSIQPTPPVKSFPLGGWTRRK